MKVKAVTAVAVLASMAGRLGRRDNGFAGKQTNIDSKKNRRHIFHMPPVTIPQK